MQTREFERDERKAPRPAAVRTGDDERLVWASAVGNAAVQRLARTQAGGGLLAREAAEEEELEPSAEEAAEVEEEELPE